MLSSLPQETPLDSTSAITQSHKNCSGTKCPCSQLPWTYWIKFQLCFLQREPQTAVTALANQLVVATVFLVAFPFTNFRSHIRIDFEYQLFASFLIRKSLLIFATWDADIISQRKQKTMQKTNAFCIKTLKHSMTLFQTH